MHSLRQRQKCLVNYKCQLYSKIPSTLGPVFSGISKTALLGGALFTMGWRIKCEQSNIYYGMGN